MAGQFRDSRAEEVRAGRLPQVCFKLPPAPAHLPATELGPQERSPETHREQLRRQHSPGGEALDTLDNPWTEAQPQPSRLSRGGNGERSEARLSLVLPPWGVGALVWRTLSTFGAGTSCNRTFSLRMERLGRSWVWPL